MTLPHPNEECPWCGECDKWKALAGELLKLVEIGLKISYDGGLDDTDLIVKKFKKKIAKAREAGL